MPILKRLGSIICKAWISVLEATCQIFILRPYFRDIGKRLAKTPKVYFTDVGTPCYLAGLKDAVALPFAELCPGYRIDWTARESTWPTPMITVSSNNQKIGVILDFMRHLLIGFVRRQTDLYTVYIKDGRKAT